MINLTLYKYEFKSSLRLLFIFATVITLYVSIIITMYNPQMMETLDRIVASMPEIMAAVGMTTGSTSLIGFMISYLYGFILLIFPMLFSIIKANALIAKYTEKGSMVTLLAAPVKRSTVVITQLSVLVSGIVLLIIYTTLLELLIAQIYFPNELMFKELLMLNSSLLCLHLFIGSICFLCSCIFHETKYSIGLGAGIALFMYVLQMLANASKDIEFIKYFTFFTLFDANGIVAMQSNAQLSTLILLLATILLFGLSIHLFCKKDLHI